jgi:hypothetical protein
VGCCCLQNLNGLLCYRPYISELERAEIVSALSGLVDEVICPAPLLISAEYLRKHRLDCVVHGFADQRDRRNFLRRHGAVLETDDVADPSLGSLEDRQRVLSVCWETPYTDGVSTSALLSRIRADSSN